MGRWVCTWVLLPLLLGLPAGVEAQQSRADLERMLPPDQGLSGADIRRSAALHAAREAGPQHLQRYETRPRSRWTTSVTARRMPLPCRQLAELVARFGE